MSNLGHIDRSRLDEEWVKQPDLVDEYVRLLPDAKLKVNTLEAKLKLVEAELRHEIRSDLVTFGLRGKPTKDEIDAAVVMHDRYKEAVRRLNQAKHRVDVINAALKTLDNRKAALEDLVKLFGMGYFAKPTVDQTTQYKAREVFDRVDKTTGFGRRRKVKKEK